jgi:hypothetical protein
MPLHLLYSCSKLQSFCMQYIEYIVSTMIKPSCSDQHHKAALPVTSKVNFSSKLKDSTE